VVGRIAKLPMPFWKLHNWNGYLALGVAVFHPTILLFSSTAKFKIGDLLLPLNSPGQRLYNNLGALTFYSFLFVVTTSYFRPQLRYRPWKNCTMWLMARAALMYVHGTLIDPNLKNLQPIFWTAKKVLVEVCFLIVVAASIWRWRYGTEKQRFIAAKAAGKAI